MLGKLLPVRKAHQPIADLDAMVAEEVPFRWKGKIHFIKPITLKEFLKFTQANSVFHQKMNSVGLSVDELALEYEAVISSVCDTIKKKDILQMEQAQVAALYQLIVDAVTGQVKLPETEGENAGELKKKRLKIPIYESLRLSPNVLPDSDGR